MTTTIVAAMVAAVASILAAGLSWKSARDSRKEARVALQTNRLVDAHDREVERFRTDLSDFIRALVTAGLEGLGATLAGSAVLAINPMCSDRLRALAGSLAQIRTSPGDGSGIDDAIRELESEAREILGRADAERRALLAG